MASVYFYELITKHTRADRDQDHIDIIINSHATTPDRTAFIAGKSVEDPLSVMVEDIRRMKTYGADLVAIPCNTAHYFYDKLKASTDLPILNIMEETAAYLASIHTRKAGILATDGTVMTGTYDRYLAAHKIDCIRPAEEEQKSVMHMIYGQIKNGLTPDPAPVLSVIASLRARGADAVILGCTELSLMKKVTPLPTYCIDSLDVLAAATIRACGKETRGLSLPKASDLL